jgi:hypothetical protein
MDWIPSANDTVYTIADWEDCVRDGLFIDYDGSGYFCNPETKLELFAFDVYPSMIGEPAYEQRKAEWTHINWFNR